MEKKQGFLLTYCSNVQSVCSHSVKIYMWLTEKNTKAQKVGHMHAPTHACIHKQIVQGF